MTNSERILEAIYAALDEVNKMLPSSDRIEKAEHTALIGPNSALDSLQLMNLIVGIEQQIDSVFNTSIILTDEKAMHQSPNPFSTVSTLVKYIHLLLNK